MAKPIVRDHYRPHARLQHFGTVVNNITGEITQPPSRTKQEFARECDINNIIKHFSVTGMLNHVNAQAAQGRYLDLPDALDFQQSMDIIKQAEAAFMSMPAKLRDRFGNDPMRFLEFTNDPENLDEMRKLGLATPLPPSRESDVTKPTNGGTPDPAGATKGDPPKTPS